jgi:hypothetical protein
MRDLLLILPRPLTSHHHGDPAFLVNVRESRLGLKIGMLLS